MKDHIKAASIEITSRMRDEKLNITNDYGCIIWSDTTIICQVVAKTATKAICLAALKAVGVSDG